MKSAVSNHPTVRSQRVKGTDRKKLLPEMEKRRKRQKQNEKGKKFYTVEVETKVSKSLLKY